VILYFNAPAKGGELAFPFYDPAGRRVNNALVDELDTLADKGVFYKNRIQVDKQTAFCVKPQCNRAVIFDTRDHTTWHQGTDVKQGVKMAYVAFFE
jgi:hypothetical protein